MTDNLSHELFGFGLNPYEFYERLRSSPGSQVLGAAARRAYLADRLRYRLRFDPRVTQLTKPDLEKQTRGLELYLLCTCLDLLAGSDFIDFAAWLAIDTDRAKRRHGLQEDEPRIAQLLADSAGDLHHPDVFRAAAAKLHGEVYAPRFHLQRGFVRLFHELPDAMRRILTDVYVISSRLSQAEVDDLDIGERVIREWRDLDDTERIDRIAKYIYVHRRNYFTHLARASRPRRWTPRAILGETDADRVSLADGFSYDLINDVVSEGDRFRIVAFRGLRDEDETLVIRLTVAGAWLQRLGYDVSSSYVEGFRRYQLRREAMYAAMSELDYVLALLRYYAGQRTVVLHDDAMVSLPELPVAAATRVEQYLEVDTPLEGGIADGLRAYASGVDAVNAIIRAFNEEHIPRGVFEALSLVGEARDAAMRIRRETYERLTRMREVHDLPAPAAKLYEWLLDLADRMTW